MALALQLDQSDHFSRHLEINPLTVIKSRHAGNYHVNSYKVLAENKPANAIDYKHKDTLECPC